MIDRTEEAVTGSLTSTQSGLPTHRVRRAFRTLGLIAAAVVVAFGPALLVLLAFGKLGHARFEDYVSDPGQLPGSASTFGMLSNIGLVVWAVGGTAVAFVAVAARGIGRGRRVALGIAAVVTACLLADDLFLLHERVLVEAGISESTTRVVLGVLLVIASAAIGRISGFAVRVLLLITGLCFAAWFLSDAGWLAAESSAWRGGAKFLGISGWCTAMLIASGGTLRGSPPPRTPRTPREPVPRLALCNSPSAPITPDSN